MSLQSKISRRIVNFVQRQIGDIRREGWSALFRKLCVIPMMLVAVPAVLFVRVLSPLILIRFRCLISARLGHFAGDTEVYLCEREAGMHSRRTLDIFYHSSSVSNRQLKKMWDRSETLHISYFAYPMDKVNRFLPGGRKHVVPWRWNQHRDIYGLLERTRPHISFTQEEERLGRIALRQMGISDGTPFVCFHSRSPAYLDKTFPNFNWRYHDYRDMSVKNLIPAAGELVWRGYFAVRTGAVVEESLETTNPRIIDYATKGRTEFLDIFLGAKCHFYLGSECGFNIIPQIFRRPVAMANIIPLEYVPAWASNYLFIPKKLWLRKEGRFATFREALDLEAGRIMSSEEYERLGVDIVENIPEEITALAVEMDERLKGTWQASEEDEELQRRFWALFKPSDLNKVFRARLGAEFLRQNRELLE